MPPTPEVTNGTGEKIKIGTTGTISSLMSRELESAKDSPKASTSSRKKLQTTPISVPCHYSPKRAQLRRSLTLDPGSRSPLDTEKPKPQRNSYSSPMVTSAEKNISAENVIKQKKHTHIVEVVDLKCNNPMSSRFKKLGFSKLSESIA